MHRLSSLLPVFCAGCGTILAATVSSSGVDHAAARPEEADALLYCGGRPCDAAPLQREYRKRLSKVAYLTGGALDAGLLAIAIGHSRGEHDADSRMIVLSGLFIGIDVLTPLLNSGFDGTAEPWRLAQPVTTDFRGQRIDLSAIDLVQNGKPLSTFSVAALQRLQRDATVSSNGFTCLLHAGAAAPGKDTVAAIFDAMNETEHLHLEDVRSLSDVFRSTAESVAPALRIPPPEALLATSDCNRDCMARRIGATFIITGTVRNQEGELLYSVRASNVPSGTVIAAATASGKTLADLAAALRKLAARLFGCRE